MELNFPIHSYKEATEVTEPTHIHDMLVVKVCQYRISAT